jgi:hypothetical protein
VRRFREALSQYLNFSFDRGISPSVTKLKSKTPIEFPALPRPAAFVNFIFQLSSTPERLLIFSVIQRIYASAPNSVNKIGLFSSSFYESISKRNTAINVVPKYRYLGIRP